MWTDLYGILLVSVVVIFPQISCNWEETFKTSERIHNGTRQFPWICALTCRASFVSTCTIITLKYVVVSLESLRNPRARSNSDFIDIKSCRINAGYKHTAQIRPAQALYVPNVTDFETPENSFNFMKNPKNLDGVSQDVYGVALNLGLIKVSVAFDWKSGVQYIPKVPSGTSEEQMKEKFDAFRRRNEQDVMNQTPCQVATWRDFSHEEKLIATKVVYVPNQSCKEAYCIHNVAACPEFPKFEYLMCYQSLIFIDFCPDAMGAALYCESFDKQVIGILTTALNCGSKNLPCVYTSIEIVRRFFRMVTGKTI